MRRIPLKTVMINLPGADEALPFRYADPIIGIINASAQERGLPLSEVAKSLRVLDAVRTAQDAGAAHVTLEDADFEHLLKHVRGFTGWRLIHQCVVDFVASIESADVVGAGGAVAAQPSTPTHAKRKR